jgi:hypothetical protein
MCICAINLNEYLSYFCVGISLYLLLNRTCEHYEDVTVCWLTKNTTTSNYRLNNKTFLISFKIVLMWYWCAQMSCCFSKYKHIIYKLHNCSKHILLLWHEFHIIITVHLHESNETKLNQLMHKLSHLYCSVLIICPYICFGPWSIIRGSCP